MSRIGTLYIPYSRLAEATEVFLHTYRCVPDGMNVVRINVAGNVWGYVDYLDKAWALGDSFINMEHDIVPWPGAIQSLLHCRNEWCFFGYLPDLDFISSGASVFGLTKFESSFIARCPDVWQCWRDECIQTKREKPWLGVDVHMGRYAREHGLWPPHQHFPSVLNANPLGIPSQVEDHDHLYAPAPSEPGVTAVLVCTFPGCTHFKDQT